MDYKYIEGDMIHQITEELGFGKFHIFAFACVSIRNFAGEATLSMISILAVLFRCEFALDYLTASYFVVLFSFARIFGSSFIGKIADNFGRRKTMFCFFTFNFVLSVLNALSSSFAMIVVTRMAIGLVFDAKILVYPYIMEMTPVTKRNLISFLEPAYFFGYLYTILVGIFGLRYLHWRWFIIICESLPLLLSAIGIYILPESPRFLFSHALSKETSKSLRRIAKANGKLLDLETKLQELIDERLRNDGGLQNRPSESDVQSTNENGQLTEYKDDNGPMKRSTSVKEPNNQSTDNDSAITLSELHVGHMSQPSKYDQHMTRSKHNHEAMNRFTNVKQSISQFTKNHKQLDQSKHDVEPTTQSEDNRKAHCENVQEFEDLPHESYTKYLRGIYGVCSLRFVVHFCDGIFILGTTQLGTTKQNPNIHCGDCTSGVDYEYTYPVLAGLVIASWVAYICIGKLSRQVAIRMLLLGLILCFVPFYFDLNHDIWIISYFVASSVYLTLFTVTNIYESEVVPTSCRTLTVGVGRAMGNVGLVIGSFTMAYLFHVSRYLAFGVVHAVLLTGLVMSFCCIEETKDIPLSD